MVVYIENSKESFVDIEREMKEFRNEHGKITPEFAMQILTKTNHCGNFRFLLKEIKKLELEERKYFSEFVIQAVHKREHVESIYNELKALAVEFGLEKEFKLYDGEEKIYSPNDCKIMVVKRPEDTKFCSGKDCKVVVDIKNPVQGISYHGLNMKKVKVVQLNFVPDNGAVSYEHCYGCDVMNVPGGFGLLDFRYCDFDGLDKFISQSENFKFENCNKLPKECCCFGRKDLPYVSGKCYFSDDDFEGVETLMVDSFGEFFCIKARNLTANISFSDVEDVYFNDCDLSKVDELKLCEGCKVCCYDIDLPKKMYFPKGCKVVFSLADFSAVEELVFDNVEQVSFGKVRKLPKKIDLSKVKDVDFDEDFNFNEVEELVFSSVMQKNKFLKGVKYDGKISYTSFFGMGVMGVTRRD
jgi:hypothetical protein